MTVTSRERIHSKCVPAFCVVAAIALTCSAFRGAAQKSSAVGADEALAKVAEIEQIGGKVGIDGEEEGQPVWMVDLSGTPIDGKFLSILSHFTDVEVLSLGQTEIGDADLQILSMLKKLKELDLSGTRVTDTAVEQLTKLDQLKIIKLNETQLTDRGLLKLARMKSLEEVQFEGTQVTEAAHSRYELERLKARAMSDNGADRARQFHRQGRLLLIESHGKPDAQDRGVELLEQAIALAPENEEFMLDLADAYAVLDLELTLAAAIDLYEQLLDRHPDNEDLLGRIAKAYSALENSDQAFEYVERRLNVVAPNQAFDVASQIVGILAAGGSRERTMRLLEKALKKSPYDLRLQLLVAAMQLESGNKSEARRIIDDILKATTVGHPAREAAEELLKTLEGRS